MPKQKKEAVSVSFHHFQWRPDEDGGQPRGISQSEFDSLVQGITNSSQLDVADAAIQSSIRAGELLPFYDVERETSQLLFGSFDAAYLGHAFVNSEKGKIEANSLNLRRFGFLLYLASSGKLYVGTQYLGNYGSYGDLRSAIKRLLPNGSRTLDFAYRDDSLEIGNLVTKEIRIEIASGSTISSDAKLGARRVLVLRPDEKEKFSREIANKFFDMLSDTSLTKRSKIKALLREVDLQIAETDEIESAKMIVTAGRNQQTLYLFDGANFATKFPLDDVQLNQDGHPEAQPLRKAMHHSLAARIISRAEAC